MGAEESVPFLTEGDYCFDREGLVAKVVFIQAWDGGKFVRIVTLENVYTTRDLAHLTKIDTAFYKLFDIQEI